MEPLVRAFTSQSAAVRLVMASEVVVACVVVELPVMSKLPTMVEEAAVLRKPPERVSKEVVAEPP